MTSPGSQAEASKPGAVVAPIQLLLTVARPVFDLGVFCTFLTDDS